MVWYEKNIWFIEIIIAIHKMTIIILKLGHFNYLAHYFFPMNYKTNCVLIREVLMVATFKNINFQWSFNHFLNRKQLFPNIYPMPHFEILSFILPHTTFPKFSSVPFFWKGYPRNTTFFERNPFHVFCRLVFNGKLIWSSP